MTLDANMRTVTIGSLVYEAAALPPQVQELLNAHERWNVELTAARVTLKNSQSEVNKLGLALAGLNNEIIRLVNESGATPLNAEDPAVEGPAGG